MHCCAKKTSNDVVFGLGVLIMAISRVLLLLPSYFFSLDSSFFFFLNHGLWPIVSSHIILAFIHIPRGFDNGPRESQKSISSILIFRGRPSEWGKAFIFFFCLRLSSFYSLISKKKTSAREVYLDYYFPDSA